MSQDMIQATSAAVQAVCDHPGSEAEWARAINESWEKARAAAAKARQLKKRGPSEERITVELPLARKLMEEHGHHIERQVSCPGGRVDIVDYDENAIIECKVDGSLQALFDAAKQLKRYEPYFPGKSLLIAVPVLEDEARWLAKAFRAVGIQILQTDLEP